MHHSASERRGGWAASHRLTLPRLARTPRGAGPTRSARPLSGVGSIVQQNGRPGVVLAERPLTGPDGEALVERRVRTQVSGGEAFGPDVELSPGARAAAGIAPGISPGTAETEAGADDDLLRLTAEEQAVVAQLRARDSQVRTEEKAHAAAAGDLAGAIQYTYTTGPDGVRYATGGSVPIAARNPSGDPRIAERQADRLAAAANAAINPSAADQSVARSSYAGAAGADGPRPSEQAGPADPGRSGAAAGSAEPDAPRQPGALGESGAPGEDGAFGGADPLDPTLRAAARRGYAQALASAPSSRLTLAI